MAHGERESWLENHRGKDYGGRRLGNKNYCNGAYRRKEGKKKTHTMERAETQRLLCDIKREMLI